MSFFGSHKDGTLKGYDPRLMRRLLAFLKPYRTIFILAMMAILLSTAGELYTPILIQQAVDRHILPYYRALRLDESSQELIRRLRVRENGLILEGLYFFPSSRLSEISGSEKRELRDRAGLLKDNFFVVNEYQENPETERVVHDYPQFFLTNDTVAVIRVLDFAGLSKSERTILRAADYDGLTAVSVKFLLALLAVIVSTFAQIYLLAYVGQMLMRDLRVKLFDHSLGLSLKFMDTNPVGKLVTRITNDVETINELFTTVLSSFLRDLSLMIGVLIALFVLSPRLAMFTLITMPPVIALTLIFRVRARNAFRRVRQAISSVNSFLSEHISGMRIVQIFNKEGQTKNEFDQRNDSLLKANLGEMYVFATFRPLVDMLATISIAVIIYFGARLQLNDMISLGVLIAFLNLIRRFFEPVRDLSEKYNILQSAMAGAERVFELLDEDARISQPRRPKSLSHAGGGIVFDKVNFWYKEGEPVLNELSFQVEEGETVAIVGYTGAGKTTITSLLTRMWDIQGGSIRLGGIDIKDIPTDLLRQKVQSVLQDVFLFSGSIEDNICLGKDIPMSKIEEVIRLVHADSFIDSLPLGIKTKLGERGSNLSMGQRQLLSFARVLAHDPDILVLDEATGNIDTETEKLIQEALRELLKDRTSIVIAHRLSTIRNADRILVLDRGELLESGTHSELIAREGLYHSLYQMQFQKV